MYIRDMYIYIYTHVCVCARAYIRETRNKRRARVYTGESRSRFGLGR